MSRTEKLLEGKTVPELTGMLSLNAEELVVLNTTLTDFGIAGKKGFNLGIAALGILAGKRRPLIDEETLEHIPFIFGRDDIYGSFKGFKHGLGMLSSILNVEIYPEHIENVHAVPVICSEHIDSDLVMVSSLIKPTENNRIDLELPEETKLIAAFTIMHEDGVPLGVTI